MTEQAKNVLVVVLDTVRAKSTYVANQKLTPQLKQLAEEGASFERAVSPAPWTFPAHASMFTGMYPTEHGATQMTRSLPSERTTIAETLTENGFVTGIFSANGFLTDTYQMTRGFNQHRFIRSDTDTLFQSGIDPVQFLREHTGSFGKKDILRAILDGPPIRNFSNFIYYKLLTNIRAYRYGTNTPLHRWDNMVVDHANQFIEAATGRSSHFFAFVNLIEAHAPWQYSPAVLRDIGVKPNDIAPPSRWKKVSEQSGKKFAYAKGNITFDETDRQILTHLYRSWVHRADSLAGELLQALESLGIREDTLVVLTSDHGELIADRNDLGHTTSVGEDVAHVPLAMNGPGVPSETVSEAVSLKDIYGTILENVGLSTHSPSLFDESAQGAALIETSGPYKNRAEDYREHAPWLCGKKRALYTRGSSVERHYFMDEVYGDEDLLEDLNAFVHSLSKHQPDDEGVSTVDDSAVRDRLDDLGYM